MFGERAVAEFLYNGRRRLTIAADNENTSNTELVTYR
jgi:hypothetical protein